MPRLIRLLTLSTLLILTSCVSRDVITLKKLPLPASTQAICCWQALQQLEISYKEEKHTLLVAAATQSEKLSLVAMGPLGRKLLSIEKNGSDIVTHRAPEIPKEINSHFLLSIFYLSWWPNEQWKLPPEWKLILDKNIKTLQYKNHSLLEIQYTQPDITASSSKRRTPRTGEKLTITHLKQPLVISVITKQFEKL
ncbi:MAG: DUF3261 domain-containing protein [Cellvibrionaceae bacterium]